jgi:hypothetical protein
MGNLPNSRTVTLNPSDPVPSSLLTEIQDDLIALKSLLTGVGQAIWPTSVTLANLITLSNGASITGPVSITGGGVTLSANQHVTISGTGQYKHGTKSRSCGVGTGTAFRLGFGGALSTTPPNNGVLIPATAIYVFPLPPLASDETILSVSAYFDSTLGAAAFVQLFTSGAGNLFTGVGSAVSGTSATLTQSGLTTQVSGAACAWCSVQTGASAANLIAVGYNFDCR